MLRPPTPGLRRLHNKTKDVAKVEVSVGPYDELEVSEDVAAQLQAQSAAFVDGSAPEWPEEWNPAPRPTNRSRTREDKAPAKKATRAKKAAPKADA
jgi:hypothetical protein